MPLLAELDAVQMRMIERYLFFDLPEDVTTPLQVDHLGQRTIQFRPRRSRPWHVRAPEQIEPGELENAVYKHGPPLDVVRAEFSRMTGKLVEKMEYELMPRAASQIKSEIQSASAGTVMRNLWSVALIMIGMALKWAYDNYLK